MTKIFLSFLLICSSLTLFCQNQLLMLDFGFSDDPYKLSTAIGIINNMERNKPEKAAYFVHPTSRTTLDSLIKYSNDLHSIYQKDENLYPPSFIRNQVEGQLTYERFYYKYDKEKDALEYLAQIIVSINEQLDPKKAVQVYYLTNDKVLKRDKEIRALLNKKHIEMEIAPPNLELLIKVE